MVRKDFIKPDGRYLVLYSDSQISELIIPTNPPHAPFIPNPHMRWHQLREEWVVYAAHRQNRTFLPPKEYSPLAVTNNLDFPTELPAGKYDIAVFENLFPSFYKDAEDNSEMPLLAPPAKGICEVMVFTQNPDVSLGQMSVKEIKLVLQVIADRTKELGEKPYIKYVLPFENRGVEVGVTLHHPHGQIYSYPFVPPVPARLVETQKNYFDRHGKTLLQDVLQQEATDGRRVLVNEPRVKAFIPSFARYAYETWIVPDRPHPWFYEFSDQELEQTARVLKTVLMKFDRLWNQPFPYLMTFYQAPTDGDSHKEFHSHIQIYPAYRAQGKLKYLAGTELGAGVFVNDSFPEDKAKDLIDVKIDEREVQ